MCSSACGRVLHQDVCEELQAQEEQAHAVLKEVALVSRVASPKVLEELSADCSRMKETIAQTKDLIHLKREERDKGLLTVINGQSLRTSKVKVLFQNKRLCLTECLSPAAFKLRFKQRQLSANK